MGRYRVELQATIGGLVEVLADTPEEAAERACRFGWDDLTDQDEGCWEAVSVCPCGSILGPPSRFSGEVSP
jgi:hypothetical protein